MKRIPVFFSILFLSMVFFVACHDDDDNDNPHALNSTDTEFMRKATQANLAEVSLGQLALTRAVDDSVRMYAQMMVEHHTMGLAGLDSLADQYNLTLPTTMDSMHLAMQMQLSMLSGSAFDSAYITSQIADHNNSINLYQNEVNNGRNQNIRNYASRNLPLLYHHRDLAIEVKEQLP
jgi:putative membrane protein